MVVRRVAGAHVGFVNVAVSVKPLVAQGSQFEATFLVDTGALDSMAPDSALRRIGIEPEGVNTYELADGSLRDYPFAFARLEFLGSLVVSRILFGPEAATPLLGVLALERRESRSTRRVTGSTRCPRSGFEHADHERPNILRALRVLRGLRGKDQ